MNGPGYRRGQYLGTVIDGVWWKRYLKDKLFARGSGEYWLDPTAFCFRRYLTKTPIRIPLAAITGLETGTSHAGRWLFGTKLLKLSWTKDGGNLCSGFVVARSARETETVMAELQAQLDRLGSRAFTTKDGGETCFRGAVYRCLVPSTTAARG